MIMAPTQGIHSSTTSHDFPFDSHLSGKLRFAANERLQFDSGAVLAQQFSTCDLRHAALPGGYSSIRSIIKVINFKRGARNAGKMFSTRELLPESNACKIASRAF